MSRTTRIRAGSARRVLTAPRWGHHVMLALLSALLAVSTARAQSAGEPDGAAEGGSQAAADSTLEGGSRAAADSTAGDAAPSESEEGPRGLADLGRALQQGDSTAVLQELLRDAEGGGFVWIREVSPSFTAEVEANVQNVVYRGRVNAGAKALDGGDTRASFGLEDKAYRQQDRDFLGRDFDAGFTRSFGEWAALDLSFDNRFSEDVTVFRVNPDSTYESTIKSDQSQARASIKGGGESTYGFRHGWAARGNIQDVQGSSRGTNNDRTLASGGGSGRWGYAKGYLEVVGKFGYDTARGERSLRGKTADATTTQDTVGTSVAYRRGRWFNLTAMADRMSLLEERLDFRRNSSGVVDTATIPDALKPELAVGEEREQRVTDQVNLNADSRPFSRLGLQASLGHQTSNTRYRFSGQGLELRADDRFGLGASFRYAEAGSLTADYKHANRWDDRRPRGTMLFRGRESRVTKEARFSVEQRLFTATQLSVDYSQRLTQNIFDQVSNLNDRDELIDRVDARIVSRAMARLQMNVGGTFSVTRLVNIDADRVGNNKDDRLFEVRGGYRWLPLPRFSFEQNYRLQIVFIDFLYSNDRDQFNKQGQFSTETRYDFSRGGALRLRYSVDFRRNGTRQLDVDGEDEVYRTDLRRFDHRVTASMLVPVWVLEFGVDTERGFLRDENPTDGTTREEDRGEVRMRVSGNYSFFNRKASLRVDVQRVLAFGPRVRPENEDYWVANSGLTVDF